MDDLYDLRVFAIIAWIQLPTVMYGGYALLAMLTRAHPMSDFQRSMFRAGHAHAGVLTLMAILYYILMSQTTLPEATKVIAALVVFIASLLQSGGFFVHMSRGEPGARSIGTTITTTGAGLLGGASLFLAWAMVVRW